MLYDNNRDYYIANLYENINGKMHYHLYDNKGYTLYEANKQAFLKFKNILNGTRFHVDFLRQNSKPVDDQYELVSEMAYEGDPLFEIQTVTILRKNNNNYHVMIYP